MYMEKSCMMKRILNLTLEILYLLTGEDFSVITTNGECFTTTSHPPVSADGSRSPNIITQPSSLVNDRSKERKILEITNKMIEQLTREVPIRCQDVTVHLSMEEWEYLEEHKDRYQDVLMEEHRPPAAPDGCSKRRLLEIASSPPYTCDYLEDLLSVHPYHQVEDRGNITENIIGIKEQTPLAPSDQTNVSGSQLCTDGISPCITADHELNIRNSSLLSVLPLGYELENITQNDSVAFANHVTHRTDLVSEFSQPHKSDMVPFTPKGGKIYQCSECDKSYMYKSYLVRHQRTHTGEKPYPCPHCGKTFGHQSKLVRHQRIHTGEKPYVCSDCEKSFTQKNDLVRHQRLHMEKEPFLCPECGKRFTQKFRLSAHLKLHAGAKPEYQRFESDNAFSYESKLLPHHRSQTGVKTFLCHVCDKRFSNKTKLSGHERMHNGELPFPCTNCGKCFIQKYDLLRHQRSHWGEKPFSCSECETRFAQKSSLVSHQRIHSGVKPFSCSKCFKSFTQKSVLSRHQRIHQV